MRKYILLLLFLCLHCTARGQTSYTYSYWLDNDYTTLKKVNVGSSKWHADIDMSQETVTLHSLHIQVADGSGNLSSPLTRCFIAGPIKNAMTANVWFDNNPSTMKSLSIDGNVMWVDAKDLPDGFHLLHVQVNGSAPSSPQTSMFIKVPQTQGVDYMTCLLYVDDTLFKQEKVSASGGVVNWSVDADSLSQGLHKANVVVVTPSGAATSAYSAFFLRVPNATEFAAMKCYYAIDGHNMTSTTGTVTNGLFHFDLDLSELKDGLHSITYMLNDGKGMGTSTNTQFFMKTPLGGYGIIQYMYWLNDQYDKAVVKTVDPRQETVRMLSLLPINQQPIRSSCFQFTVKDGKPVVYAKNDLHVRFYDASGRFVDAQEQYVDENVMQQVTNVKLLESGKPSTATKPAENKITWYKVMAERGDSLTFKVRQSCTLNLFSPSGKELYSASAPEILEYGGAYANEDGTYYVAVHDAKSKNENNVTVDYQHIDKYAVLDYTPKEIGITESYVYINLDGNGLDKLDSVRLVNGSKIISANKITVKSKASAELQFAVYGEESPGTYDLIFNFRDGQETRTVTISQAVRFANPDFGDMAIEITPTRRAGFPYPVILSVKNTGNVSKLYLPFNIGATFNEAGEMPSGDLNSCSWTEMYTMNFDVLFDSEDEEYSPYTLTDNLIGTGHPGVVLHGFIPEIGPQETKEFILGFVGGAHAKFNLYAWTGKALNDLRDSDASDMSIYSVSCFPRPFASNFKLS